MKSTATHQTAIRTTEIFRFYVFVFFRPGILCLVLLLLPGCVNNGGTSANAFIFPQSALLQEAIRPVPGSVAVAGVIRTVLEYISEVHSGNPERSGNSGDAGRPNTQRSAPPTRGVSPARPFDADYHIDIHDAGEEEKIMTIIFPALMRIALMVLLIALII